MYKHDRKIILMYEMASHAAAPLFSTDVPVKSHLFTCTNHIVTID